MSLLLDALKKAADDKQKASNTDVAAEEVPSKKADVVESQPETIVEAKNDVSLDEDLILDDDPVSLVLDDGVLQEQDNKLELEELELTAATYNPSSNAKDNNESSGDTMVAHQKEERVVNKSTFTVSDDALSLLINKTNRDVKQSKKIVIIGLLFASLSVLLVGGYYSYSDMQAEIASIERKHDIAMRSMKSKTNNEKAPTQSAIIRNLVSDADLADKVEYAKAHRNKAVVVNKENKTNNQEFAKKQTVAPASYSIQKTQTLDPTGEKLDDAWIAYEAENYLEAREIYKQVLVLEKNNRDALLGLGAIAVIEKDISTARRVYLELLNLDPHDPIATSALASLKTNSTSLAEDEAYIASMLKKNPGASQLNFTLGNIYAQQDKWKLAQQSYFNAWQNDSENADYLFNLAISMDQLGKRNEAKGFYQDSLTKSKNKQVSFSRELVKKRN